MKRQAKKWFLALALVWLSAPVTGDELDLVGLAMHRETGRDIYLAALHAQQKPSNPADIATAGGERAMEFRIVARRTSIRSILGGILLQAELASDAPPSPATVEFANAILSSVQGSLYDGDTLTLRQTAGGNTEATIDGQAMASTPAAAVFDYFLSGWVGERGASTAFRNRLLSPDIDVDLRADYRALVPAPERIAAVRAWVAPAPEPTPEPAAPAAKKPAAPVDDRAGEQVAAATQPRPAAAQPAAANHSTTETAAAADTATEVAADIEHDTAIAAIEPAASTPAPEPAASTDSTSLATTPSTTTPSIAMARIKPVLREENSPASALAEETEPADPYGVASLSIIEYSQRLATFNSMVFRMVNSEIRYPRAAIRRGIQGNLELDVTLDAGGGLVEVAVARSSGHYMLDDSALRAAREAFEDTLGNPPDNVARAEYSNDSEQLVVPVPVNFVLTE